jgi:hypothetical protein
MEKQNRKVKSANKMATMKRVVASFLVFLAGIACGAYLHHPPIVHAQNAGVRIQKVNVGFNMVIGSEVIGFACQTEDCYIAVRQ